MLSTDRFQLPYPEETDANDYPAHMLLLAARIKTLMMGWSTGKLSDRSAAGINGRFFSVSGDPTTANNGRIFYDNGTTWHELSFTRSVRYSGTLDGSGVGHVDHPFGSGAITKIQNVQAFFKGNSGEAVPLNILAVDDVGIGVSNGYPGRAFYATLTLVDDDMPW